MRARDLCMTLQGAVNFQEYFRCYVVDQQKVHVMRYDPGAAASPALRAGQSAARRRELGERIVRDA